MNQQCAFRDAVVARHLDGDVHGSLEPVAGWQPDEVVAEHLRDCSSCQQHLQRSRRLDAVLAESSGRASSEAEPAQLDRLLQQALVLAAPLRAPVAAARVPRWLRNLLAATGLLAGGFLAAFWFVPRSAPPPAPAATTDRPGADPVDDDRADARAEPPPPGAGSPAGIPLGTAPALPGSGLPPLQPPRSRADVDQLVAVLTDRALGDRLQLQASLLLQTIGLRPASGAADTAAFAVRRRCSEWLCESSLPHAGAAWIAAVAGLESGVLLDAVLTDARRRPDLRHQLRARLLATPSAGPDLDGLAAITVAARIGGRDLDAALRTAVRRDPRLCEVLAAALRTPAARPGRTALLLDVFGDLVARGAVQDEALAAGLFAGLDATAIDELGSELQQSRQSPRRVRCLLALGALRDGLALPLLVEALRSPVHEEALAAAFAIGQLPAAALTGLPATPGHPDRGQRAWLWLAAQCSAGVPLALAQAKALDLSAAERELVATGGFTFAQFPVFAELLRSAGPASSSF